MKPTLTLTDDQLFEGFDSIAPRLGIDPPETPGEQVLIAGMVKWFFIGARWYQFVLEHQESTSPQFSLPGIDFNIDEALEFMEKRRKGH